MLDQKGFDRDVLIFVNHARFDFVRIHFVAGFVRRLRAIEAHVEVLLVGFDDMLGHRAQAFRAVNFEWFFALQHPRREDQIRITDRVIRMQMRDERAC